MFVFCFGCFGGLVFNDLECFLGFFCLGVLRQDLFAGQTFVFIFFIIKHVFYFISTLVLSGFVPTLLVHHRFHLGIFLGVLNVSGSDPLNLDPPWPVKAD